MARCSWCLTFVFLDVYKTRILTLADRHVRNWTRAIQLMVARCGAIAVHVRLSQKKTVETERSHVTVAT